MRGEINLEVGTGSIVLGESRWLVIIYSHPVRNVLYLKFKVEKQQTTIFNISNLNGTKKQLFCENLSRVSFLY